MLNTLDKSDWGLGYYDGLHGHRQHQQEISNKAAYSSGWVEGEAGRLKIAAEAAQLQKAVASHAVGRIDG